MRQRGEGEGDVEGGGGEKVGGRGERGEGMHVWVQVPLGSGRQPSIPWGGATVAGGCEWPYEFLRTEFQSWRCSKSNALAISAPEFLINLAFCKTGVEGSFYTALSLPKASYFPVFFGFLYWEREHEEHHLRTLQEKLTLMLQLKREMELFFLELFHFSL